MEATGEHGPLRELANWFGYSLASAADEEPGAPTLEAEASQDYPPLVAFHEDCKLYRQGKITLAQLDEFKDRVFKEVREIFCRTVKGDEWTSPFPPTRSTVVSSDAFRCGGYLMLCVEGHA